MLQRLRPLTKPLTWSTLPPRGYLQPWRRDIADYRAKYAEKLGKVAQQRGMSLEELYAYVREQQRERERERQKAIEAEGRSAERALKGGDVREGSTLPGAARSSVRRDSSPIKPLSGILNTERLLSTPHTAEQISALWTAFHASRSGGTGRGFICASLPRETYDSLLGVAQRYPMFVIPIPRATDKSEANDGESHMAYEFYVLQWDFYHAPLPPVASPEPFSPNERRDDGKDSNARLATAIFAPLLEYKLHQTFATPTLVLTFYPDLASSHGLVLMRGEITPSAATAGDYLLSQNDAQLLAHGLQRFYLWGSGEEKEKFLRDFHERPGTFNWEELLAREPS
ncbi:ATP11 protein-domain-containing protein [Russula earlei]|uniref:ATP11 protein-domain-containing protein n=1 Tax=Russula earlei TaxID=71964 RepID=A0ACC0TW83_9AGAM|nr:ATP11 protein-domain-containing protein [Russula earlei]